MSNTTKKYWKGLAQLNDDPIVDKLAQNEFVEELPVDKFLGNEQNLSSTNSRGFFWHCMILIRICT